MKVASLEERFWPKVEKSDGCWNWIASTSTPGYGQIFLKGKCISAHRLSYEINVGPIPDGMQIDHTCHNRRCVRPSHLRLATHKQNIENHSGPMKNSTTGVRGVYFNKPAGKWHASMAHNNRRIFVGLFLNLEDAEAAVIAKRNELFTHNDLDRVA